MTARHEDLWMSDQLLDLHLEHLRAGGKSKRTIEARANILGRLNGWLEFGLVYAATEQLEAWLAGLRAAGRSRWTLAVYAYHVKAFYQWAEGAGFLHGDPAATVEQPRAPRCLPNPVSEEEFATMLASLPEPLATAATLAGYAGMRVSEIAACHREHVTAERILIPVSKGGRAETVPTHPAIWECVQPRPPGPLILNRHGDPVDGHWITQTARYHLDRLGLKTVHLHRLRHWYGTLIQREFGDLRVTQECMRHKNPGSTAGYTFVSDAQRRAAVLSLPKPRSARASL